MGINVDKNKMVTIDHSHQRLVDTSIEGKPIESTFNALRIQYLFRLKTTKRHGHNGNPLLYALKEMHGYRIQMKDQQMLYQRAAEILASFSGDLGVDILVDVPSSKSLCRAFAKRVADVSGLPLLETTLLRKRMVSEIVATIDAAFPQFANDREERLFKAAIGQLRRVKQDTEFQMKEVAKPIRRFFQPFAVSEEGPILEGEKVGLIDDFFSSGRSITYASDCLRTHGAIVERGICLLGHPNTPRTA